MSARSTQHGTFVLERTYPSPRERVFRAWADPKAKAQWFGCHEGWVVAEYSLDFRVGGREVWRGGPQGGVVHGNETIYQDIVPGERIIYTYTMRLGERPISVSLSTVEFTTVGAGTRLVFTEQDAFLDGYDNAGQREEGTKSLLDALGGALARGEKQ